MTQVIEFSYRKNFCRSLFVGFYYKVVDRNVGNRISSTVSSIRDVQDCNDYEENQSIHKIQVGGVIITTQFKNKTWFLNIFRVRNHDHRTLQEDQLTNINVYLSIYIYYLLYIICFWIPINTCDIWSKLT